MTQQAQPEAARPKGPRPLRQAFVILAVISGLASLVLAVVLFANDFAVGSLDIANSVELQRAREQFDSHSGDDEHAARVVRLDLEIRKDYAARRELAGKAKVAMLVSLAVFFASANVVLLGGRRPAAPAAVAGSDSRNVRDNMLGRWAVSACAVLVVAVGAAAIVHFRPWRGSGQFAPAAGQAQPQTAAQDAGPASRPRPYAPPTRDEIARNWPYFRGPEGNGVCRFGKVPAAWDESKNRNILWKIAVPLAGASSPVVWGTKVFLTAANKTSRRVLCYDVQTGRCLWDKGYRDTAANNDINVKQDYIYAAGTPALDGRSVVAVFANGDVVCFDFDGNELWAGNVGDTKANQFGYSSSLTMHEDKVIVQFDAGEESAIMALDVRTGQEIWRQHRDEKSWASPVLMRTASGEHQVIVSGKPTVSAWEPQTGKIIWWADVLVGSVDVACSPILAADKVIAISDESGMFAIRPDGKGDVAASRVAWKVGRNNLEKSALPDASSPVSDGRFVYTYKDTMLICVDARTGKVLYEQDVGAAASFASPSIAGDKLYLFAGNETLIVQVGREFKLLNKCQLEESFDASPAFAEGRIFIRGEKHLYCIGEKK